MEAFIIKYFLDLLPYIISVLVAIISGLFSFFQSSKKINQQIESIKLSNKHDLDRLMEQHKIDLDSLKEKHNLEMIQLEKTHNQEMERLEKEYKHEIDILELKSKNNINEQSQNVMNTVLGDVVGTLFNEVITGKIKPEDLDKITKQYKKKF